MSTPSEKPTIYGSATCPPCTATKEWMKKHHIPYNYVDVVAENYPQERLDTLGITSLPTVKYGAITITGHSPIELSTIFLKQ